MCNTATNWPWSDQFHRIDHYGHITSVARVAIARDTAAPSAAAASPAHFWTLIHCNLPWWMPVTWVTLSVYRTVKYTNRQAPLSTANNLSNFDGHSCESRSNVEKSISPSSIYVREMATWNRCSVTEKERMRLHQWIHSPLLSLILTVARSLFPSIAPLYLFILSSILLTLLSSIRSFTFWQEEEKHTGGRLFSLSLPKKKGQDVTSVLPTCMPVRWEK